MAAPLQETPVSSSLSSAADTVARMRLAQRGWAARPLRQRLGFVTAFRRLLVEHADRLAAEAAVDPTQRAEVLCGQLLPLADACAYLERRARSLLDRRRMPGRRPDWLGGAKVEIQRQPLGLVLVIGAGNYPVFLPGVQVVQALVAGNGVILKPAPGAEQPARSLADLLLEAGIGPDLLTVLHSVPEAAQEVMSAGVDKVLFTGSSNTGREILRQLADRLTPATLELSGCDAVFVQPGADLGLVARALRFGLAFNGGATCIAPRRVFVPRELRPELEERIEHSLASVQPVSLAPATGKRLRRLIEEAVVGGARLILGNREVGDTTTPLVLADVDPEMAIARADIFAPVASLIVVDDMEQALALDAECPYALGASVFGPPKRAQRLAGRIDAGVVVINDMIAPTADPRVSFGGRGESGFGVTRGPEGLLELTQSRVVILRRGRWRPHFAPLATGDEQIFSAMLKLKHASGWPRRLAGWLEMTRAIRRKARQMRDR